MDLHVDITRHAHAFRKAAAQQDLLTFARRMHMGYLEPTHVRTMAAALQRATQQPNTRLIITMPPRHGKALELDTPIPTPDGWTSMGELKPGDRVFDERGEPCNVVAVSPIWRDRPVYDVTTDDGDRITADADHEWPVSLCRKRRDAIKLKTTRELAHRTSDRNPLIRRAEPLQLPERALPIDPYVLGIWLGDGDSRGGGVTEGQQDVGWIRDELTRLGYETTDRKDPCQFTILGVRGRLAESDLLQNKHIPIVYLRASQEQRLALLQGLVDTDGYVAPDGQIEICSIHPDLAIDVQELVRSLGRKASLVMGRATIGAKDCGTKYRVMFYHARAARLPRKRERCRDTETRQHRYLTVLPSWGIGGRADTKCITVDSPSHLFLAGRSMLPTHNSLHVSETLPAWYLGNHPDKRVIAASHTANLAYTFSRRVRNLFSHYRWPFDGIQVAEDKGAVQAWDIQDHKGGYVAVGVGGTPTGMGADLMIIDDPIRSAAAADSQTVRENLWEWYTETMRTRLEPGGSVIVTATRWHADDLTGHLKRAFQDGSGEAWEELHLPAIDDQGRALWPERWPVTALERTRTAVGLRAWQAQYQGRPTREEGAVLKRAWFPLYDTLPPGVLYTFQSWDTAFKAGPSNDYSVCHTYAVSVYGLHLVSRYKGQPEYPDLVRKAKELYGGDAFAGAPPRFVLIEDKASGQSLGQTLRTETKIPVIMVQVPTGMGKLQRTNEATPHFESQRVHLPRWASWTEDLLTELTAFPLGAHDDEVDAMVQAVLHHFSSASGNTAASDSYLAFDDDEDEGAPAWQRR